MEDFVTDPRHGNGCTLFLLLSHFRIIHSVIFTKLQYFSNESFGARPFCKHVGPNLLPNETKIPNYEGVLKLLRYQVYALKN